MSRASRIPLAALAFFGITIATFGVTDVLNGAAADPAIAVAMSGKTPAEVQAEDPTGYRLFDFTARTQGLSLIVIGILTTAIVLVPYRAGERWSWRLMWSLPAWSVAVPAFYLAFGVAPGTPPAPPMISGPMVAAVSAAALIADRRRFVGRQTTAAPLELGVARS